MSDNGGSGSIRLQTLAKLITIICLTGSLSFMFIAGSHQKSIILLSLFTVWVISPFAGLFLFPKLLKRSQVRSNVYQNWFMIILSICSLILYSRVLIPHIKKPAFLFLEGPLISWISILIFFLSGRKHSITN